MVAERACMVAGGHAWLLVGHPWLLGGMHGCRGVCMVVGGHAWLPGGHAWLLGGVHGRGHAWLLGGCAWLQGGMHRIQRDTVNERAVRILLECILVLKVSKRHNTSSQRSALSVAMPTHLAKTALPGISSG